MYIIKKQHQREKVKIGIEFAKFENHLKVANYSNTLQKRHLTEFFLTLLGDKCMR